MLQDIINYIEINPKLGTAGQPTREQFADIQQAGYQAVINLNPATASSALPEEAALVQGLNMKYFYIPVIWEHPTTADLQQFFQAMQQTSGQKVFVHCAMNMRVSVFVFLYRVLLAGVPQETAKSAIQQIWEPNPTWQAFIDEQLHSRPRTQA